MTKATLIGLNFDGVVIRRTVSSAVYDMVEVVGCRKTVRQLTHWGYKVAFVTSRTGESLRAAKQFVLVTKLPAQLIGLGRDCQNGLWVSVTNLLAYASDQATDLLAVRGLIPHLYAFCPSVDDACKTKQVASCVRSHHELLIELSKSLPHK